MNESNLQRFAIEINEEMNPFAMGDGHTEDTFHFFSGIIFHLRPSNWLEKSIEKSKKNNGVLDDQQVWQIYTDWHEKIHMMQLVSSPTIANYCFRSANMAQFANLQDENQLSNLKLDYRLHKYEWDKTRTIEICELQAILLGFFFATRSDRASAKVLIDKFYTSPDFVYVRALKNIQEVSQFLKINQENTFKLVARICSIALQAKEPYLMFDNLIYKIRGEKEINKIINISPPEFWKWAVGPNYLDMVSMSLRERIANTFNIDIKNIDWFKQFSFNYDCFEKISIEDRFGLLLGESEPTYFYYFSDCPKVYGDGNINRYHKEGFTLFRKIEHLKTAKLIMDGINKLNS